MTLFESFLNGYVPERITSPVYFLSRPVGLLLVPGHGDRDHTKGKHNADGSIYEGEWARKQVALMLPGLRALGFDARCLVPEDEDIHIKVRAARANAIMKAEPDKYWIYLAVHLNAVHGGERTWDDTASGFIAYATSNASVFSCNWAKQLVAKARSWGLGGNRSIPDEGFKRRDWTEIYCSKMPAILVEHAFMTNRKEAAWLNSDKGRRTLEGLHTAVLCEIFGIPYAHIVR